MYVKRRIDVLCGVFCIGYFDGVVIVLMKFFNFVKLICVYFGLKDV